MDLFQLKLFKDLAATRNVSRAAQLNGISQSAASQSIKSLEKSISSKLVDNSKRPIELTDAGRLFGDFARDVLRRREELESALGALRGRTEGVVRIASIYSVGISEMTELERQFQFRCPDARLTVEYLRPERVYESVSADTADLGLVSYPISRREIQVIPWREEEMVLAVSPHHSLAAAESVELRDLHGLEFVAFDEDLPIRRDIDRFLEAHGVHVKVTLHFDNLQSIKDAVEQTRAVSIMPARVMLNEARQGRLVPVRIREPLFRPLGIIHRKRKQFAPAAQAFLSLLQELPASRL